MILNNSKFFHISKLLKKELTFSKKFFRLLKKYLHDKWSMLSEHTNIVLF